jgi:hypothetical protein
MNLAALKSLDDDVRNGRIAKPFPEYRSLLESEVRQLLGDGMDWFRTHFPSYGRCRLGGADEPLWPYGIVERAARLWRKGFATDGAGPADLGGEASLVDAGNVSPYDADDDDDDEEEKALYGDGTGADELHRDEILERYDDPSGDLEDDDDEPLIPPEREAAFRAKVREIQTRDLSAATRMPAEYALRLNKLVGELRTYSKTVQAGARPIPPELARQWLDIRAGIWRLLTGQSS